MGQHRAGRGSRAQELRGTVAGSMRTAEGGIDPVNMTPPQVVTTKCPLGDNSPQLRTTDQGQKLKDR